MYPHFLGIGAMRSGTTWLHSNLLQHKNIWLPHLKEIHYFDRKFPPSTPSWTLSGLERSSLIKRRLKRANLDKLFAKLKKGGLANMAWECKYYFGGFDDEWYASLFANAGDRLAGDITPSYSILDKSAIEYIHGVMPNAKLIFLMRNPIDRAWSHAIKDFTRFKKISPEDIPEEEYLKHFSSPGSRLRGDYARTIENWTTFYPKEQLFTGYYDQLKHEPEKLMADIYEFLGVEQDQITKLGGLQEKVNAGKQHKINDRLKEKLIGLYHDDMVELERQFGGFTTQWLQDPDLLR